MKIKCPACSKVLEIPESAAGKVVKCPCGKQLRAPGAAAAPAAAPKPAAAPAAPRPAAPRPTATRPAPTRPAAARPAPARPAPARPMPAGGIDQSMFDELTDDDLKPVAGGGLVQAPAAPTGNTAKLLQEHAATAGGSSKGNFRVGDVASPWSRLAAAIIDGFVIGFLAGPIMAIMMAVLGGSLADLDAVKNATTEAEQKAAAQKFVEQIIGIYFIALPVAYSVPIALYAWMVTSSGQTPGKKLCKIRIVTADTKQLPGFVKGVLIRGWAANVIYCVPFVGLIGILMIFGNNRQCLHDIMAGTIVVDT